MAIDPIENQIRIVVRRIANFFCLQILFDTVWWCASLHYLGWGVAAFPRLTSLAIKNFGNHGEPIFVYDTLAMGFIFSTAVYCFAAWWWSRRIDAVQLRGARIVNPFEPD
jgi:hypothetical protein